MFPPQVWRQSDCSASVQRYRLLLRGRRKALDAEKRQLAVQLYHEKNLPVQTICAMMQISKPTLYAYVRESLATSS